MRHSLSLVFETFSMTHRSDENSEGLLDRCFTTAPLLPYPPIYSLAANFISSGGGPPEEDSESRLELLRNNFVQSWLGSEFGSVLVR